MLRQGLYGWTSSENDSSHDGIDKGRKLGTETGLIYFGARYYDPRTSVWQSPDPILAKYLPTGDKEKDKNLPGMGGVFNSSNLNLFAYTHQNPVKYIDPDGSYSKIHTKKNNPHKKGSLNYNAWMRGAEQTINNQNLALTNERWKKMGGHKLKLSKSAKILGYVFMAAGAMSILVVIVVAAVLVAESGVLVIGAVRIGIAGAGVLAKYSKDVIKYTNALAHLLKQGKLKEANYLITEMAKTEDGRIILGKINDLVGTLMPYVRNQKIYDALRDLQNVTRSARGAD